MILKKRARWRLQMIKKATRRMNSWHLYGSTYQIVAMWPFGAREKRKKIPPDKDFLWWGR
jgi:hypothetical protein